MNDPIRALLDGDEHGELALSRDQMAAALRAVLDLHKADSLGCCQECSDERAVPYPCPTGAVIADALGVAE